MTGWTLLGAAIVAEIIATTTLTYSHGLTRHTLTALTAVFYIVSYVCLAKALAAGIAISVAYAAWSGIGTAALAVIGASVFGESLSLPKVTAIALIVSGVLLLHLTSRAAPTTTGAHTPPDTTTHEHTHHSEWRPSA